MSARPQPTPPSASVAADGDVFTRRYRAFLSYSHADTKWATWLLRRLESYRVPERFHGRAAPIGEIGARLAPVFRDRDELPTADDLGDAVRDALARSATLIVICSPASARSRWVNEEVLAFKRLGRSDRVFALIVDGEPNAKDEAQECFAPALRFAVGTGGGLSPQPIELIAADARPHADGKETAFIRLVAGLLGVGFDELRQRELVRRQRRLLWITVGSTAGMAITFTLAVVAWLGRNDAQRRQEKSEALMATMLEDLKTRLAKADRLDDLDASGKELLAYFQSLTPRDLTDITLTQQAKALTQIGQMRITQLRYADAVACFTAALNRSAALVERHPRNGDMRFERAQAEYWIGNVHYKNGELPQASEWFARYRDSGVALAGLDPKNVKWQREAVSGHHNLAVLELVRGHLAAARQGMLGERAALEKMTMTDPLEAAELQSSIANADSFLGTIAERAGDFGEAIARFGAQAERLETLIRADPRAGRMKQRFATALALQSDVMAVAGQLEAALARRRQAQDVFDALTAQDAANREWQFAATNCRLKTVPLFFAHGETARANQVLSDSRPVLEDFVKGAPSDRNITMAYVVFWRLEAQRRFSAGDANAGEAATQAVATARAFLEKDPADETRQGGLASACLLAGLVAQRTGDQAAARRHWATALATIEAAARESNHWRILDPAARVLGLLDRARESTALIERLNAHGYLPLEPWLPAGGKTVSVQQ